jgi:hypothetical protein
MEMGTELSCARSEIEFWKQRAQESDASLQEHLNHRNFEREEDIREQERMKTGLIAYATKITDQLKDGARLGRVKEQLLADSEQARKEELTRYREAELERSN